MDVRIQMDCTQHGTFVSVWNCASIQSSGICLLKLKTLMNFTLHKKLGDTHSV